MRYDVPSIDARDRAEQPVYAAHEKMEASHLMHEEEGFIQAIAVNAEDERSWLAYADWLDERGDRRGELVRLRVALKSLTPDHPQRPGAEHALSRLRVGLDAAWVSRVEDAWAAAQNPYPSGHDEWLAEYPADQREDLLRKDREPFPHLDPSSVRAATETMEQLALGHWTTQSRRNCSICDRPFEDQGLHRVWISLAVATDVLPLLVNACSEECIARLPRPTAGYVASPHRGGPEVLQPPDQARASALREEENFRRCEEILRDHPTNWEAWRLKASYLQRHQRYEEALECWDRLYAGLPGSALHQDEKTHLITPSKDPTSETFRTDAHYLERKAQCLREMRRFDEALDLLRQAQRITGSRGSSRARRVVDIENNYTGQLVQLIRMETGILVSHKILKYNGRVFMGDEIAERVRSEVMAHV